jgi:hypothetical protein
LLAAPCWDEHDALAIEQARTASATELCLIMIILSLSRAYAWLERGRHRRLLHHDEPSKKSNIACSSKRVRDLRARIIA